MLVAYKEHHMTKQAIMRLIYFLNKVVTHLEREGFTQMQIASQVVEALAPLLKQRKLSNAPASKQSN
jgi:hypothetical protein